MHFLVAQGLHIPTMTIYQDTKSTILLSENGMQSSSRRTKHLNVRYFFVTDKIQSGEVKVAYCPTENMLAFFYQTPTGIGIPKNAGHNSQSALLQKLTECTRL